MSAPHCSPTAATPARPDDAGAALTRAHLDDMRRVRLRSEALLAGANEIEIQHGEAVYRLRLTSLGKLILTK